MKSTSFWFVLILGCILFTGYVHGDLDTGSSECTDCYGPYSPGLASTGIYAYTKAGDSAIYALNSYNQEHNLEWTAGITSKSSLSDEEKKHLLGKNSVSQSTSSINYQNKGNIVVPENLPDSFDWRNYNGDWTTSVKDQGTCGSCYAFATTGIFESYWKRVNNDSTLNSDFAEQYLVSCDSEDDGCDGGLFENAMPYFVDHADINGGIGTVQEIAYPYTAIASSCISLSGDSRYTAEKWGYVRTDPVDGSPESTIPTTEEIKAGIYLKGPLAVGIHISDPFYNYVSGIYEDPVSYDQSNHAVILVGWGEEDGKEYFIGKNSWGTGWGESGWFKIEVNSSRIGEGAVYFDFTGAPVPTPTSTPGPYILANFSAQPVSGSVPLRVNFTDSSKGSPEKWEWSFGDGLRSVDKNPIHTYMKPGSYTVSLTVSRGEYKDYLISEDLIHVKPPYQPVFAFPNNEGGFYPQPSDPNDDGLYEDINGNGWLDFNDPILLFEQMEYAITTEPVAQFDFDGSGFIGFEDVTVLNNMV